MKRLYYLDNLKVCLTVLVIMHHAGQAYGNGGDWAYTPSNPAEFMPWIWHFFSTNAAFFMGLYFFISGYFVPISFDRQGTKQFIRKKLLRLGVPLLFMGGIISVLTGKPEKYDKYYILLVHIYIFLYLCSGIKNMKYMKNMRVAILGYGNIGKSAEQAVLLAPDMELVGVYHHNDSLDNVAADVVLICTPTREMGRYAELLLEQGVNVVDSFDVHGDICMHRSRLGAKAVAHRAVSVVAAGWDPGTDSVMRAMLLAMAPEGVTYTNFGPGRSMGHTVAAKAIKGVKDALSMTIPMGRGVHARRVYIELEEGADFKEVEASILADEYFAHDDTRVEVVESVAALNTVQHGVKLVREGVSSGVDNQQMSFDMTINNPALTAQVMVSCARAVVRMQKQERYGAYTMIELSPISLLPGDEEELIGKLV